jgi:hypothetical protein
MPLDIATGLGLKCLTLRLWFVEYTKIKMLSFENGKLNADENLAAKELNTTLTH